jgi:hypothetical protein
MNLKLRILLVLFLLCCCAPLAAGDSIPFEGEKIDDSADKIPPEEAPVFTPGLDIDLTIGVGKIYNIELPVPFVITVKNSGGKLLAGDFELDKIIYNQHHDKNSYRRLHTVPITLPSPGAKRLHFCLPLNEDTDSLVLRLRSDRKILWQRRIDLNNSVNLEAEDYKKIRLLVLGEKDAPRILRTAEKETVVTNEEIFPLYRRREVQVKAGEIWETPKLAAPLFSYHGIVITPGVKISDLFPGQARALAEYLQWGGTLVFSRNSKPVLDAVIDQLPPQIKNRLGNLSFPLEEMYSTRVLCGKLVLLPTGFIHKNGGGNSLREKVISLLEDSPEPSFPRYLKVNPHYSGPGESGYRTLMYLLSFFGLYLFLTGPVVLFFFRKRGKQALRSFVVATVAVFCLLSLAIAPALELRKGDVDWLTVTELTSDGGVQWGLVTAISAGGAHHNLHFENSSCWLLPSETLERNYRYYRGSSYSDNILQPNRIKFASDDREDVSRLDNMPITPWGRRLVLANSYWPEGKPFTVKLEYKNGLLSGKITNHLPVTVHTPTLFVSGWGLGVPQYNYYNRTNQKNGLQELEMSFSVNLNLLLKPSGKRTFQQKVQFSAKENQSYSFFNINHFEDADEINMGNAEIIMPQSNSRGKLDVYVIGQVKESPALKFSGGSFNPGKGRHYVIYQIDDAELPFAAELLKSINTLPKATPAPAVSDVSVDDL